MQRKSDADQGIDNQLELHPTAKVSRNQETSGRLLATFGSELRLTERRNSPIPDLFQLLIEPFKSWEPGTIITYSFQIPLGNAEAEKMMSLQPHYVDHQKALSPFNEFITAFTHKQLVWWESATSLHFVETNEKPMLYFYEYQPAAGYSSVYGFSMVGTEVIRVGAYLASIGINAARLNSTECDDYLAASTEFTILHEIGHSMLGFKHPFDLPVQAKTVEFNTTSFSVMAYKQPIWHDGRDIISISPMPADLDTAHFLYGKNLQTRIGNDVYQLSDFTPYDHPTLSSLPWDAGGIDTLSASDSHEPVRLDIRPYGKSRTRKGGVYTPNVQLENVVSGSKQNTIYLNEWNNQVDITKSKHTTLYIDPLACGHDTIVGFNPRRDNIRVIAQQSAWQIRQHPTQANTTLVEFGRGNTLELVGVLPEQFHNQTITVDPTQVEAANTLRVRKQEVDAALESGFHLLNYQLSVDFLNAFGTGAGLTFIDSMTEEALKMYGMEPENIEMICKLLRSLYIIMTGTIITNAPGMLAAQFLPLIGIPVNTSQAIASGITTGLHVLTNLTPMGLARVAINYAGNYAGSYFTLWARDKIKSALAPETKEIKHFHPGK